MFALVAFLGLGYVTYSFYLENQNLKEQVNIELTDKESLLADLEEVETNLMRINKHESSVLKNLNASFEDRKDLEGVKKEIAIIEELINRNEKLIEELETQAESKDEQLDDYANKIDRLKAEVGSSKQKLASLMSEKEKISEQLASAEAKNENLEQTIAQKEMVLNEQQEYLDRQQEKLDLQERELYTAYYLVDDFKTLKQKNVAVREGGLFGLATKDMKADFNKDEFTRVDIRQSRYIPIFAREANLLSTHDPASYEFIEEDDKIKYLHIIDPDKFWVSGKFLVVETKPLWEEVFAMI